MGVLESVKIRKDGYAVRKEFKQFYIEYGELDPENFKISLKKHHEKGTDFKELTKNIIIKNIGNIDTNFVLFGKTKVYLKNDISNQLNLILSKVWNDKSAMAQKIQKQFKVLKKKKEIKSGLKDILKTLGVYRLFFFLALNQLSEKLIFLIFIKIYLEKFKLCLKLKFKDLDI